MKTSIYSQSRNTSSRRFGFTLVELMVVMFIIATLASIGFGLFFKMRDTSKEKDTIVFLKNIRSNMEAVKAETGTPFPTNKNELYNYLTGNYTYANPEFEVKPFMPELMPGQAREKNVKGTTLVDAWGREIEYTNPGVRNNFDDGFDLKSDGIDPDETSDDIEL